MAPVSWSIKDLSNFFEAMAFGFGEEEPCDDQDENKEYAEYEVVVPKNEVLVLRMVDVERLFALPSDLVECDWVDEGENDERAVD